MSAWIQPVYPDYDDATYQSWIECQSSPEAQQLLQQLASADEDTQREIIARVQQLAAE